MSDHFETLCIKGLKTESKFLFDDGIADQLNTITNTNKLPGKMKPSKPYQHNQQSTKKGKITKLPWESPVF